MRSLTDWDRLLDDATRDWRYVWLLIAFIYLTRLPLLLPVEGNLGISSDPDAPGHAITAMRWWYNGYYRPSRPPGYFPTELLNILLFPLGWFSVNLLNTLIFAFSSILIIHILRYYQIAGRALIWFTFALLPEWIVENCSITEHTLSIACLIGGWYALIQGRYGWSGVLMGLAMAARVSQTPLAVPIFALELAYRLRSVRVAVVFIMVACITLCLAWFIPTWLLTGNLSFLQVGRWQGDLAQRILGIGYDLQRAFGLQALIVIFIGLVLNLDNIYKHLKAQPLSPFFWNSLIVFALIIYTPNKVEYALLMTPFLIPLLSELRRAYMFYWSCVMLLSFLLIAAPYVSVYEGRPVFHIIASGKIAQELRFRREGMLIAQRLISNAPSHSIIFAGHSHLLSYLLTSQYLTNQIRPPLNKYGHIYLTEKDVWIIQFPDPLWIGVRGTDPKASIRFLEELVQQNRPIYYLPQMRHVYSRYPHLLERARAWDPLAVPQP